jgi:hypothetical protein
MSRINDIGQREFFVCFFGKMEHVGPFDRFLSSEFVHVLLISPLTDKQVLIIDPLAHAISHNVKNHSIDVILRKLKSIAGCKIIKYNRPISRKRKWRFRGLYNCVTLTKAVLNIWCWSITPKQLFKYLLRQGGIIIKG